MRLWTAAAIGGGLLLVGCSSGPPLRTSEYLTVSETGVLPPPEPSDLSAAAQTAIIGPFDRISIEVFGIEDLARTVQADGDGVINFPLIGKVPAAGLTPGQLGTAIEQRLAGRYVRNPQVLVTLEESANRYVTVDGEVRQPGIVALSPHMTLMQAVARAQGTTEFAQLSHVVLFRTVNGRRMAALHDMRSIRAGIYPDPPIYAQDLVVVGESQARRIFTYALQGSGLLTAPLIALLQNN